MSLPSNWSKVNLFDISIPKQWKTIAVKNLVDNGYSVYGANGKIGFYTTYTHEFPTIMITCRGASCGNVHISEPFSYINGNAMALDSLNKNINIEYLFYYLKSRNFDDVISGSAQPQITQEGLKVVDIPLPPLNEQKRIAQKLDELLATVESIKTRLDNAPTIIKRFRQSILAAATSGKLTEEWREENGVTEAWKDLKIDNVLEDIRYGTSKKCAYANEFTPVLRIPNISDDGIITDDVKYAQFNEKELASLSLKVGDVLVIRSNGSLDLVGKNVVVTKAHEDYLFAGYLIRMRFDKKKVIPDYVHYVLTSPKIREIINLTAKSTSGVNNVNSKELAGFPISLPSLGEQKEIVSQVESLFSLVDSMKVKIEAAQKRIDKLTQSTLAKAFRGELVPQDLNDESAEKLLERIKAEQEKEKPKKTRRKKG